MGIRIRRQIARYFLSLRLSAAIAIPDLSPVDLERPAPIVRQLPGLSPDGWDCRELIRNGSGEWVITTEARLPTGPTFLPN